MSDEQSSDQGASQDDTRPAEEQAQQQEAYPTYVPPGQPVAPLGGGSGAPPVAPGPPIPGQPQPGRESEEQPVREPWTQPPADPNPTLPPGRGSPVVGGPPQSVEPPVPAPAFNIATLLMVVGGVVLVLLILIAILIGLGRH